MYPARLRGRVVGLLGTGRAAASAVAALAGGVLADRYGGIAVVAMAGLIGSACAMAYAGLRARATEIPAPFSARESLRALRQRPVLRQLVLAQGFYGGGLIAAVPLYALVNVDRLRLSLGEVGTIGILGALATTLSFFAWGAIADRHGAVAAMRLGSLLGLCSLVAYALAPSVVALWFAALALGAANPSIEVGVAAAVSAETPLSERSSALAGWNAITGVRGILAPFLMSGMVQAGLLDVTSGLLVCAAVSAVGTVLFLRVGAEPIRRPGLSAVKRSRLARGLRSLRVASADR
jgi:MFS family permease